MSAEAEAAETQASEASVLDRLLDVVAHDLKNLLMVVTSNAQALARSSPGEELDDILSASEDAGILVDALSAFRDPRRREPQELDLRSFFERVAPLLGKVAGAQFSATLAPSADLRPVIANPRSLKRALLELAVKGATAMPEGGTLTFDARRQDPPSLESHEQTEPAFVRLSVRATSGDRTVDVQRAVFLPIDRQSPIGRLS